MQHITLNGNDFNYGILLYMPPLLFSHGNNVFSRELYMEMA